MSEQPRVFKIGATKIVENDSTRHLTNEQVKAMLKVDFPEIANATITERSDGQTRVIEFLPQPGRKG